MLCPLSCVPPKNRLRIRRAIGGEKDSTKHTHVGRTNWNDRHFGYHVGKLKGLPGNLHRIPNGPGDKNLRLGGFVVIRPRNSFGKGLAWQIAQSLSHGKTWVEKKDHLAGPLSRT